MKSQIQRAQEALFIGLGATNVKLTLGSKRYVTAEAVATEVVTALDELSRGQLIEADLGD